MQDEMSYLHILFILISAATIYFLFSLISNNDDEKIYVRATCTIDNEVIFRSDFAELARINGGAWYVEDARSGQRSFVEDCVVEFLNKKIEFQDVKK